MAAAPARDGVGPRGFAEALERFGESAGRALSWLTLACVLVCFAVVVLRYVFDTGFIWMQELYVWLNAIVFTGCAGYALKHDKHVRVDIFYARLSRRGKARVDLAGAVLMVAPWAVLNAWLAWPWLASSWATAERSAMPDGMPALYLLKAMIIVMSTLLLVQGLALAMRSWNALRAGDDR
ncbi:MAG: TRAP transporter small permease subunit [Burkholderiales bacterium]|nr:TRAP transporter small permease subunit [Burkholderiales bacterium]MCE7876014.1 TRAP transporter small permease subunit [Betaproteobacteria bacterium PRO3]